MCNWLRLTGWDLRGMGASDFAPGVYRILREMQASNVACWLGQDCAVLMLKLGRVPGRDDLKNGVAAVCVDEVGERCIGWNRKGAAENEAA
jgi:hypothetical protein